MPSRFTVNDAVGRPFQVWIDDLVWIDGESEAGKTARSDLDAMLTEDQTSRAAALVRIPDLLALVCAANRRREVSSTFSKTAATLALLSLNRIASQNLRVIRPFQDGETLDEHGVELVHSFLGDEEIQRPRTRRSALRQVEWA
jgi:hypothetical protein